jgi:predicted glutamine amidotransferase
VCRLFGLHAGRSPVRATFWLLDAPDSLSEQSHRNPDGAGIGVFGPDGRATLDKSPLPAWQDAQFARDAHDRRGTTFVAHVRYASTGGLTAANTHPFLQDGRLFAHNGVVQGLDRLDERLAELGGGDLVIGDTDSERVFALVTLECRRRDDVTGGLVAAVEWISDNLPLYALNVVLSTATGLWALRYPATHELYVLERQAGGPAGRRELEARSSRISAHSDELARAPAVVVASERMDDDPGWRLLESGELIHVHSDLRVETRIAFPGDPRRLLGLHDLDDVVARSQHPQR